MYGPYLPGLFYPKQPSELKDPMEYHKYCRSDQTASSGERVGTRLNPEVPRSCPWVETQMQMRTMPHVLYKPLLLVTASTPTGAKQSMVVIRSSDLCLFNLTSPQWSCRLWEFFVFSWIGCCYFASPSGLFMLLQNLRKRPLQFL